MSRVVGNDVGVRSKDVGDDVGFVTFVPRVVGDNVGLVEFVSRVVGVNDVGILVSVGDNVGFVTFVSRVVGGNVGRLVCVGDKVGFIRFVIELVGKDVVGDNVGNNGLRSRRIYGVMDENRVHTHATHTIYELTGCDSNEMRTTTKGLVNPLLYH